jgi:cytochrome c553
MKTPGQVLYEAEEYRDHNRNRAWWQLSEMVRGFYEADAQAVIAAYLANQPTQEAEQQEKP